jgi:hypothetical protein
MKCLCPALSTCAAVRGDPDHVAMHLPALGVADFHAGAGDEGIVALVEIGDPVRERGQRDGVRAHEHLPVAMADGQRRALARGDDQVLLAVEEEGQREGAFQVLQRLRGGLSWGQPAFEIGLAQMRDGLGVGVAFEVPRPRACP